MLLYIAVYCFVCIVCYYVEEKEEEFIYHKYTYKSNFRLIYVGDGLPEKQ